MIKELFDKCAKTYDMDRRKLVPCFDDFYETVIRVIPFGADSPLTVLDMGSGTGLLASFISKAYPQAHITLTDLSGEMLKQAQKRFEDKASFRFHEMHHNDLAECDVYDLIVSSLSIHHLSDAQKEDLYSRIYRALKPGGWFINADQVRGPSEQAEIQYQALWMESVKKTDLSQATLATVMKRVEQDRNSTLADQLQWLRNIGFQAIDCWYKNFRFAVFGGATPSDMGMAKTKNQTL